jgi:helix-turn-helix protein
MEDQSASGQRAIDVDWPICLTILRIIRRWSEEDLAEACGLRRGTVSDYERGKMSGARHCPRDGYSCGTKHEGAQRGQGGCL